MPDSAFIKSFCDFMNISADWLFSDAFTPPKTADSPAVFDGENLQHTENTTSEKNKLPTVGSFSEPNAKELELSGQLVDALKANVLLNREIIDLHKEKIKLLARIQALETQVQGFVHSETAGNVPGAPKKISVSKEELLEILQYLGVRAPAQELTPFIERVMAEKAGRITEQGTEKDLPQYDTVVQFANLPPPNPQKR